MQKQITPLPAFQDRGTQDYLQKSLEGVAGHFAKRYNDLSANVDNLRNEAPLLFQTQDNTVPPPQAPGTLWFVQDDGLVYFYDQVHSKWLAASLCVLNGNQEVVSVSTPSLHYLVSRISVPTKTFIVKAVVGIMGTTGVSGTINVVQIGGATLATAAFSTGASSYYPIVVDVNTPLIAGGGLQIEFYVTSGSLSDVDCAVEVRKMA